MSAELRDRNINVNCVLPSIIDTPENRAAMPGADATQWVSPNDIAKTIMFLASDHAPLGWEHINLTGDYLWKSNARSVRASSGRCGQCHHLNVNGTYLSGFRLKSGN